MGNDLLGFFAPLADLRGVVRWLIIGGIALGLWIALKRTALDPRARTVTWLAVVLPLLAWHLVVWRFAAARGVRDPHDPRRRQRDGDPARDPAPTPDRAPLRVALRAHRRRPRRAVAAAARRLPGLSRARQRFSAALVCRRTAWRVRAAGGNRRRVGRRSRVAGRFLSAIGCSRRARRRLRLEHSRHCRSPGRDLDRHHDPAGPAEPDPRGSRQHRRYHLPARDDPSLRGAAVADPARALAAPARTQCAPPDSGRGVSSGVKYLPARKMPPIT